MTATRYHSRTAAWMLGLACLLIACVCPAPARAADPAPQDSCAPKTTVADGGPFSWQTLVFFDSNSALLTKRARAVLDDFKRRIITYHVRQVGILAHTDSAERANGRLDAARADAVLAYLAGQGLPAAAMFTQLLGNTQTRTDTKSWAAEPRNRYVELRPLGTYDAEDVHLAHRILLCRRWLLDHCIGPGQNAPAAQCKTGIDFLVRGDDVSRDLDWRTQFTQ